MNRQFVIVQTYCPPDAISEADPLSWQYEVAGSVFQKYFRSPAIPHPDENHFPFKNASGDLLSSSCV